ncbi:hypothetical protein ACJIZ3_020770 [Penstemon smallii]|uniref:TF-B3 domain-containing protein n=1 Tax=Penstemon smallii TaxID=265156 RepID=A0ABD3SJZ4_9LAMI
MNLLSEEKMELGKSVTPKHFFKVMMSGFRERLSLPPVFCRKLEAEKSKDSSAHEAVVTTQKGIWKIELCKNRKGIISFTEGWPNFVRHHNLNLGDFIVFEHNGDMKFNAFIFDPTACEKEFRVERANPSHHPKNTKRDKQTPHFILTMKPYHGGKRGHAIIPIEFVRSSDLSEKKKKSVILRGPSTGKTWPVNLYYQKTGRHRCGMCGGWPDFYKFNKLKNGDVCHFELNCGDSKQSTTTINRMEGKSVVPRHFFKVMMPGFSESLNLPQVFCRKLEAEKSKDSSAHDEAIVTTQKGISKIKLRKNRKGLISFEEGWPNFVHHHALNLGDFIVFEHNGNMNFNAFIFDPTACEKQFRVERANPSQHPKNTRRDNQSSPHFILTMKPYNGSKKRGNATIPIEFAKSNSLSKKECVILRVPSSGKTWPVKLSFQKTGQSRCRMKGRGWCEFYESNKLKNGDVCHFMLNHGESKRSTTTVVMDVQIFRAPA